MTFSISPLTKKRFRAFRRIRRAWYSLIALGAIFVFCMLADVVCPVGPREVADPDSLADSVAPVVKTVYDIRSARFSVLADGAIADFEGPADVREALLGAKRPYSELEGYEVRETPRGGYTRVYLEPKDPPKVLSSEKITPNVAFPFAPCKGHPFGLDEGGRDVYTLVVHGMRIGLLFGILLAFSGMLVGLVVGSIEGYFGGKVDLAGQRFTEIWSAIPFIYVMIFIGQTVGQSFGVLLFCYAIFNWISVSYYMRAEFLRLRMRTFVEAAKCQGFSAARIIFGHILPNALTPLITLFPFLLMGSIGSLAALDFLGFGLPPMTPSCGELLNQAMHNPSAWWLIVFPSAALFIVMLLTVLVGEGLRDAFDPRQKSKLE